LGCFGLLTLTTAATTKEGNMGDAEVTDPIEAAKKMVSLLKTKNVDYIVCLGHIGVDRDLPVTSDLICSKVPGIDIFIDGHSHIEMEDGKVVGGGIDLIPSDTLIASAGCYCKAFGILKVDKNGDMSAKLYRGEKKACALIDDLVARIHEKVEKELGTVVCVTTIALDGEHSYVRNYETNLGDLVTDSMRISSGADICVINGGGVRASLEGGEITMADVYMVMPFQHDMVLMTVTGESIYDAMEYSYAYQGENFGGFLQVSGMTVFYDISKDAGSRIVMITVDGEEMDPMGTYTVVTSDFVATGGDGFTSFVDYPRQNIGYDSITFGEYLKGLGTIDEWTIEEGRLISV